MLRIVKESRFSSRLKYPFGTRPTVTINGNIHKLADFSESGIKIITGSGAGIAVGAKINGKIHFHSCGIMPFSGEVVRTIGDLVAIKLRAEIPLSHQEDEQLMIKDLVAQGR